MRILISVVILLLLIGFAYAKPKDRILVDDPSMNIKAPQDGKVAYYYRARGDINMDGLEDIMLSTDMFSSQNGMYMEIYLQDSSEKYFLYDSIFEFPGRVYVENYQNTIRLWTYWHNNASEGVIAYDIMTDSGLVQGEQMIVHGGDGGTPIGRALTAAISNSQVKFIIEKTAVHIDSTINWQPCEK